MSTGHAGVAPAVSIVMPTYQRRDQVVRAVEAVATQRVDVSFEIVVVSDGSTDGTEAALAGLDLPVPLTVLTQANGGPAAARNRGIEEARGDLIVFVDDDLVASPGMLQAHIDGHREIGPNQVVIGPMLDPPEFEMQPWVRWEQAMLRKQYDAMDAGEYSATPRQFYTGNASVQRAHLIEAGGFDTSFRRAEDVELAYRLDEAGLGFHYLRDAVGWHFARRSFTAWRTMAYDYGRNDVIFARDRRQAWIFPFMARKYREHRTPLRWLIAAAVRSGPLAEVAGIALRGLSTVTERFGLTGVTRAAYSCIYGMQYHRGIADELGGRSDFFAVVRNGADDHLPAPAGE